jgi:flagellar biosynthesis protein FlhA
MAAAQASFGLSDIGAWFKRGEIVMAFGVIMILVFLVIPIPGFMLDFLLSISVMTSILILMTSLLIKKPLEFSAFPTVLLVTTLFRLSLNVASTRLILSQGHEGDIAAGAIIKAFGQLLMQGNFIIGLVLFAIFVLINFIVITKGSGRIAEVAARFTLDSMPGKQMAIDADLSAGLIDPDEAKRRRKEVEQESGFFGAMDGASKFVRGDAVAGLIITAINIVGGMLIGMISHGLSAGDAADHYIRLTVGDGLVTQIPALIISMAAGFLVSKAGVDGSADKALVAQLLKNPVALGMVSATAGVLALVPGMPIFPFAGLSLGAGFMAWTLGRAPVAPTPEELAKTAAATPQAQEDEPISTALMMDDIKVELGLALLGLINESDGRKLTDQIKALRRTLAAEFGFVMPSVRILDNMRLGNNGYTIRIKEMEAGTGEVRLGALMAIDPSGKQVDLPGDHVREPAFGLPATWIDASLREEATFMGYTIVDPATVITTHLTEIIKDNMAELLSYSELVKLLKDMPEEHKKLVDDLIPSMVSTSTLQRVLQALLKERVSIRDMPSILEGLGEAASYTKSVTQLVEHARARLSRQLCWQNRADDGALPIITLSPDWEMAFANSIIGSGEERQLTMAPSQLQEFIRSVRDTYERVTMNGDSAVLLTSPNIRPFVRSIIERFRAATVVMSQNEIHPKIKLKTVGQV